MELVAVGVESEQLEPARLDLAEKFASGGLVGEQALKVAMGGGLPVTGVELDPGNPKVG